MRAPGTPITWPMTTAQACCAHGWGRTSRCRPCRMAKPSITTACASPCTRPAMCSDRPRCGWSMAARSGWPRATTRPRPTAPAPLRARALRHLHHRIHLRPAHLPLAPPARAHGRHQRLVAGQRGPGPALGAAVLCLRQGPAHPAWGGPPHRPHRRARRGGAAQCRVPRSGRGPAAHAARDRPRRGCTTAQDRPGAGAALGAGHAVDAPVSRPCRCLCQRLDAAARHAPPPWRGPGLRHVRPCRLARPAVRHCATGAERVFVTHGSVAVLVRWLREQGLDAQAFQTEYGDEDEAAAAQAAPDEAPAP